MRFELRDSVRIQAPGAEATRAKVVSYIGARVWAMFQVDIVAEGIQMTEEPDEVAPLTGVSVIGGERTAWRAYPLVDHIADKVCAVLEDHQGRPSTRFKDLIDLVAIATGGSVGAPQLLTALRTEAQRRGLDLPERFDVPDVGLWKRGYEAEARRTVGLTERRLEDAIDVVRELLDPLLAGSRDAGGWLPGTGWTDAS